MIHFKQNVRKVMARDIAAALRPRVPMAPSQWAAANLIVPDGPRAGQAFDLSLTPYLAEPLDMLGPDSAANEIAVMKSAQTGFTLLLIALIGHLVDRSPCRAMVIQPTTDAVSQFNREKLDPAIKNSRALRGKIASQTSRSSRRLHHLFEEVSRRFAHFGDRHLGGGSAIEDRPRALARRDRPISGRSRRPGRPARKISDGSLISFLASGDWKKVDISTPTIKGASKIERRYEQGDQRRWHVPCTACGSEFVFEFPNFRFEAAFPHKAFCVAPCCGSIVENHEKLGLVRKGRWVAGAPRPGSFPSYHLDALASPFVPWDEIAKAYVAAGDSPERLKTFWNLWLGLPFEIRGDAPDHVKLMERREDGLPRGHVPPRGLILVAAADVQMRGIWVEIVAFAPNRESWVVEAFYCDGSTEGAGLLSDPPDCGNAFTLMLHKTIGREFPDAFGRMRKLDALGIDSGYRSHVVYATVRKNQLLHPSTGQDVVHALDGRDGWGKPPIGAPALVDIDLAGHRVKRGVKIWPVGTWALIGALYSDLRKDGLRSGAESDPPGYCHFPSWLDEGFFRQITSEYLAEETFKGRARKFWKLRASERDNHFLDCRIYNMALAEHLGLSSLTADEWAVLAKERGMPPAELPTLFAAARKDGGAPPPPASLAGAEDRRAELAETLKRLGKLNARIN